MNDLVFKIGKILIDPLQQIQQSNIGNSTKTHSLAIVDQINVLTAFYRDMNSKIKNKTLEKSV